MEIVHKELKLLLNLTLLIDREVARILFNEIATNKTIVISIRIIDYIYDKTIIILFILLNNCLSSDSA
jgi:hypothetical protein